MPNLEGFVKGGVVKGVQVENGVVAGLGKGQWW